MFFFLLFTLYKNNANCIQAMILHTDRYFEHIYDVKHDLLCVKWPTIENLYLPEILNSIKILVENVKNYNIRHLLIDGTETQAHSSNEDANKVVTVFINGLKNSRLEKLARVESPNQDRESVIKALIPELMTNATFEIKFFKDVTSALIWLQNPLNQASF